MTDTEAAEAMAAIMVRLARLGISADVQGLLVHGDERGTVAPHALYKAIVSAGWLPPEKART